MSANLDHFHQVTSCFRDMEGWQIRDQATTDQAASDWKSQEDLNPEAFRQPEHVGKVLKFSKDVFSGEFFTRKRMGTSLIHLREQYLGMACNEVIMRYEKASLPLQNDILSLNEKVKEMCLNPEVVKERNDLMGQVKDLASRVSDLYKAIKTEKEKELQSPLAKDCRSHKKVIAELDLDYQAPASTASQRSHEHYLAKIEQMKLSGFILDGVSQEDCWKWKGRVKALRLLQDQTLYTAHALHCLAYLLDPIMAKIGQKDYLKKVIIAADAQTPIHEDIEETAAFFLSILLDTEQ